MVNGTVQTKFIYTQNLRPLYRSAKNLSQLIMSTTSTAMENLVDIVPRGLLGKYMKYSQNFFMYTPF